MAVRLVRLTKPLERMRSGNSSVSNLATSDGTKEQVPRGIVECRVHHLAESSRRLESDSHRWLWERDRESELVTKSPGQLRIMDIANPKAM